MRTPERIDQVIPAIVEHDAVSNHTFEAQRLLREMGLGSEIYARIIGPGCAGRVRPIEELSSSDAERQWLLYQSSIGSPAAEVFAHHRGRKLLDYHNITPAELVERWIPPLGAEARLGRRQLAELAPLVAAGFADSAYNAAELATAGFARTRVVPLLVETANVEASPDAAVFAGLMASKAAGGSDWLFVGQLAPHKAQHDLVKAFACYRRAYDERARLHLVGREMGQTYKDALRRFVASLGLGAAVELTGSVPATTLAAYYAAADVFVCCSEHEGFCAPVVEAMHRRVPVVAIARAALPETIGDGGVLLGERDPVLVAAAVHEVLATPGAREALVEAGARQAGRYGLDAARRAFRAAVDEELAVAL